MSLPNHGCLFLLFTDRYLKIGEMFSGRRS